MVRMPSRRMVSMLAQSTRLSPRRLAVRTAEMAIRAGVDWLEVGTPLIIAEGMRGVRELRARFPENPSE